MSVVRGGGTDVDFKKLPLVLGPSALTPLLPFSFHQDVYCQNEPEN